MGKKKIIIKSSQKQIIREYLDKEYGIPLYRYLQKGNNIQHKENGKLQDSKELIPFFFYYITKKSSRNEWIDFCNFVVSHNKLSKFFVVYGYGDERYIEMKDRRNLDDFIKTNRGALYRIIAFTPPISKIWENFIKWYNNDISTTYTISTNGNLDAKTVLYNPRVNSVKWLIHFTPKESNAIDILKNGFKSGVKPNQISKIAYTGNIDDDDKTGGVYSFAYDVYDVLNDNFVDKYTEFGQDYGFKKNYDKKVWSNAVHYAVMFQAPGIKVNHMTDQDEQVIFNNKTARNFVLLRFCWPKNQTINSRDKKITKINIGGGDSLLMWWEVVDKNLKPLYKNASISEVIKWVVTNYEQYNKVLHESSPLNESIDELDLYHGTNADFNQFSEDFFLSGVGEMAMGWGAYLTNSLNTAKAYSPGGQVMTVQVPDGKYLDGEEINPNEAMNIALKFKKYYLSTEYGKSAYGDCPDEFWRDECSYIAKCVDGSHLYGTIACFLGNDKDTSRWLRSIGYVGLRFYSTNVNTGEKSVNYVIFDVNDIKIINKQQTDSLNESVNMVRGITELDICKKTMGVIERRNGVELSDEGKKWFIGLMNGAKFGITMDMILEKAAFSILNIPSFPVGQSVGNEWDELDGILRIVIQKTGLGNDILQRLRVLKWGEDRKIISDGEWAALETALQYYPDILKELKRCYGNFAVVAPVIYKAVDYLKRYKDGTAALEFCYLVGYQREHARASLDVAVDQVLHGVGSHLLPQITSK